MTIFNLITLFGGLALFLYGMRLMGDGLKKGSSDAFKRAMEKVTNNPLVGFLLGLVVTAVIQSSTATIVLTSGLVGAGVMSLHQSIGVILGANVGTTITGQIIRLLDVNASETSLLNFFKPSILDRYADDDNELDFTDDRLVIEEAIRDFSPREREVIELRFVKGMTQIEIAKKLGISQVQVSRLLRRTLKKIQDKIDPDGVMVRS